MVQLVHFILFMKKFSFVWYGTLSYVDVTFALLDVTVWADFAHIQIGWKSVSLTPVWFFYEQICEEKSTNVNLKPKAQDSVSL